MSEPLKVLIADDAALYRTAIANVLAEVPDVRVVGMARNGRDALEKLAHTPVELITLDIEMPEMSGLELLPHLQQKYPKVKTIVVSQYTEKGAELTLEALRRGALDFITKPTVGSLESGIESIRRDLLRKVLPLIREAEGSPAGQHIRGRQNQPRGAGTAPPLARRDVVAIGISTGGPKSLMALFEQIPESFRQAILIVQHMPPLFTRKLAAQLSRTAKLPIAEAREGEKVENGRVYLAPGDFHMEVKMHNGEPLISLHQRPPENFCRPAVDVLFRSIACVYGARAVGVVMTGMGNDGLAGAEALKKAGAPIIAQDRATSVVWGMPKCIIESNLADAVAPLQEMYRTINSFVL